MKYFIELPIKEYIEKIAEFGAEGYKVFFSTQKNVPIARGRYDLFYQDGSNYSVSSWTSFIETIYHKAGNGNLINLEKTWESFEKRYPVDVDKVCIVECLLDEDSSEEILVDLELVYEKQKNKNIKAAEFKEWLVDYMKPYGVTIDPFISVAKLVAKVEEYCEKNNGFKENS